MTQSGAYRILNAEENSGWRAEYPFESNFFEYLGKSIHFIDEGPRDGDPILMVHGNPTWSFFYRNLIKSLRHRYRTIAIDHLGCGLSDKPSTFDYCLPKHRDNLAALVDALNLRRVTLVAHDWGGAIGLATLLKDPKRYKRIVLFNTGAFPPPYIPFRIRVCRWPIVGEWGVRQLNLFARAAIKMATTRKDGLPKTAADGLLAPYDNWDNRVAIYQFVKDIPNSRNHRTWELLSNMESQLKSLAHLPISLIWGMKDWCFRPECLRRFQSHWPDAEVHEIENAGHYILEDAKDKVAKLVNGFLENHPV